jgi:SiaC family regulatory phosphoprotein
MEALRIELTDETPLVILDPKNNVFEFSGKSLPEDVITFYKPVLTWLDTYGQSPNAKTLVDFKMIYFNTASSKMILDILFKLEELNNSGTSVSVRWFFQQEDDDMKEAGEEYGDLVEIPFELQAMEG